VFLVVISASADGRAGPSKAKRGWLFSTAAPALALSQVRDSTQLDRNELETRLLREKWQARGLSIHTFRFYPARSRRVCMRPTNSWKR